MAEVTVGKRSKHNVRETYKIRKMVGGSNEHCCLPIQEVPLIAKGTVFRGQWLHKIQKAGLTITRKHTFV